jgi:hypothetical protein
MKKLVVVMLVVALLAGLGSGLALAVNDSQMSSAKATAQIKNINFINQPKVFRTILTQEIKTANQKDLFIDVSLQSGLYTMTKVKGKKGDTDTATAKATVRVRVKVDDEFAYPGARGVIFNEREQKLTATLGGVLQQCEDLNGDGVITKDECTWTDEEIELILDTMSANSFNFIVADLSSGPHKVEVQAMIQVSDEVADETEAKATIGMGSVTIEEVRMLKGENWCVGGGCP